MVDAGLTVIQDSIGSATPENTGELIKFSHANNNNNNCHAAKTPGAWGKTAPVFPLWLATQGRCVLLLLLIACAYPVLVLFPTKLALLLGSSCLTSLLSVSVKIPPGWYFLVALVLKSTAVSIPHLEVSLGRMGYRFHHEWNIEWNFYPQNSTHYSTHISRTLLVPLILVIRGCSTHISHTLTFHSF